jgi:hypothetical protein
VRSIATVLGLATASLVCLCAGALIAVSYEGLPRLLFAGAGFAGYLYFLAHALREVNLPSVLVEGRPDPERQRPTLADEPPAARPVSERETRRDLQRFAA